MRAAFVLLACLPIIAVMAWATAENQHRLSEARFQQVANQATTGIQSVLST